jgi:hypothetical protein
MPDLQLFTRKRRAHGEAINVDSDVQWESNNST